ncbi:MAG: aryl-sulfate sulfotransferase, partial [Rhodoferax sp.]
PALLDSNTSAQGFLLPDYVVEIKPSLPSGGSIVWEWHMWDHMIQNFDASKNNYGVVADHPERVNPNGVGNGKLAQFWNHVNGIDYNPTLDQIMISVRGNSELMVIDHSTTTAQAASHSGGKYGKGGDIIYRWGYAQQYGQGSAAERKLYQQHHTHWIEPGLPGAGNILIFNNGIGRSWSSVDEIVPPVDANGNYPLGSGAAFGPSAALWTYTGTPPSSFYSQEISGAQRLPNGNTLITSGVDGTLFEVTSTGETVWKYINPVTTSAQAQGSSIAADSNKAGQFMNAVFRVTRYGADFPGLQGKTLAPLGTIETN